MRKIRLGTRGSRLALAQVEIVRGLLPEVEIEPVVIRTRGDKGEREVLGAFVRDIEAELLEGTIDVALHCLKDLPTERITGLRFSAYLKREDPRDAIISVNPDVQALPLHAVVGTGSIRRTAQLAARRSDLRFKPLVGNVDTRLRKLESGEYDAIVLAVAGLRRLGLSVGNLGPEFSGLNVEIIPESQMLPAPGQGVLVLQTREEDSNADDLIAPLDDAETRLAADLERRLLRAFGGGCSLPLGALATTNDEFLNLQCVVARADGEVSLRVERTGRLDEGDALVESAVDELIRNGASELIASTRVGV